MQFEKLPFKVTEGDELISWRHSTFWSKEPETLQWLRNYARNNEKGNEVTLIDVGANIGLYTCYWLSINKRNFAITCEPFLENLKILKKNLEINEFSDRVLLVENPISEQSKMTNFQVSDYRPGGSGYCLLNEQPLNILQSQLTLNLDKIGFALAAEFIIKIDTDGNDFNILKGAQELLSTNKVKSILIESDLNEHKHIQTYLSKYGLAPDKLLNELPQHSDFRRIKSGKPERNRIYTKATLN